MKEKNNDTLVVVPVLNEEKSINIVIEKILNTSTDVDILVVDDGSTDKTLDRIKNKEIFVVTHLYNMGIGVSFQTGCQFALNHGYNYIVRMDGDGQHDPIFIKDILTPIKNNEVDIAIGSRFLGKSEFKSSSLRLIGIKIISTFMTLLTKKKVTDPTSGLCAMNKKAFSFFSNNCADDYPEPEILVYHKEFKIKEVPISISKRHDGISSITPLKSIYYMVKVMLSLFIHIFRGKNK